MTYAMVLIGNDYYWAKLRKDTKPRWRLLYAVDMKASSD